jgi:hypothetical protein
MKRFLKSVSLPAACLVIMAGVLIFLASGCKSPTSTDADGEADIIVTNETGETVDIYLDGEFKFWLADKTTIEIDNVTLEEHALKATRHGTDDEIESTTIEVEDYTDYTWTVDDPPDIKVTNSYGKTLQIYMDGVYQFDLTDEEDRWILDVEYGERFVMAFSPEEGRQVASVSITIDENMDYAWTIE